VKQFSQEQFDLRGTATRRLQESVNRVEQIVEQVCRDVRQHAAHCAYEVQALDAQSTPLAALMHAESAPAEVLAAASQSANGTPAMAVKRSTDVSKFKSMVAIKEEKAERLRRLKNAQEEAELLGDFIRLVDYMTVERLAAIGVATATELLSVLRTRKQPLFRASMAFGTGLNDGIVFSPSSYEVHRMADSVLEATIATLTSISRVLYGTAFKTIVAQCALASSSAAVQQRHVGTRRARDIHATEQRELVQASSSGSNHGFGGFGAAAMPQQRSNRGAAGLLFEAPHVDTMIRDSKTFQSTQLAIARKIDDDFGMAKTAVQALERFRPVHDFGITWNAEAYRARSHTVTSLQKDMLQQEDWAIDMERTTRYAYEAGMLQIESKDFKDALLPVTVTALSGMKELLLRIFHSRATELLSAFQQRGRQLDEDPTALKAYAAHVDKYNAIRSETTQLLQQAKEVETVRALLDKYGIRLAPQDAVLFDDLRAAELSFAAQLDACERKVEDRLPSMRQAVYKSIARVSSDVQSLRLSLNQGTVVDSAATAESALSELDRIRSSLMEIKEQAATLQGYQTLFGIEPYAFTEVSETMAILESRVLLWTTLRQMTSLTDEWNSTNIRELDIPVVDETVNNLFRTAHKLHKEALGSVAADEAAQVIAAAQPLALLTAKVKALVNAWKVLEAALWS